MFFSFVFFSSQPIVYPIGVSCPRVAAPFTFSLIYKSSTFNPLSINPESGDESHRHWTPLKTPPFIISVERGVCVRRPETHRRHRLGEDIHILTHLFTRAHTPTHVPKQTHKYTYIHTHSHANTSTQHFPVVKKKREREKTAAENCAHEDGEIRQDVFVTDARGDGVCLHAETPMDF